MAEYLVFTLAAALSSMGELAGHERRGTRLWPGRSAILGLVAAALGIRREDGDSLSDLEALSLAVSVLATGEPLRDYHTVQTVPTAAARRPDSRRNALTEAGRKVNTMITVRDYRVGVAYGAALWGRPGLDRIVRALERPVFTLYLGRKACPLSAPLAPRLVEASGPAEALAQIRLPPWIEHDPSKPMLIETEATPGTRIETRHDVATDRMRWHFASREVSILPGPTE